MEQPHIDQIEAEHQGIISRRSLLILGGASLALSTSGCISRAHDTSDVDHPSASPRPSAGIASRAPGKPSRFYVGPDLAYKSAHNLDDPAPYNGMLDAGQMAADGIAFQIMRAGRGGYELDPYLQEGRRRLAESPVLPGFYYVLEPGNARKQATHFRDILIETDPYKPGKIQPKDLHGTLNLDIEFLDDKEKKFPSYKDIGEFTESLRSLLGDRTLLLYTYNYFWDSALKRPPAVPHTKLWWAHYLKNGAKLQKGNALAMAADVSAQGTKHDPYPYGPISDYPDFFTRQYTSSGYYQQFQGQSIRTKARGKTKRVIDFSITYKPWESWLHLANMPPGSLPYPKPLNIK